MALTENLVPKYKETSKNSGQESSIQSSIRINIDVDSDSVSNHVQSKSIIYGDIKESVPLSSIIEYANGLDSLFEKAQSVQSQNHSHSKVHGIQHVKNVLLLSNYLGQINGLSPQDLDILREAAIYHDIRHEYPGDKSHAKNGANWYLQHADSNLNKNEVAFLIAAHELNGEQQFADLLIHTFPNISKQRQEELIKCAMILQDADRLDILRYDIENPYGQRFKPYKLNDPSNIKLIPAVIELNTRQAIKKGYLHIVDGKVCLNKKSKEKPNGKKTFAEESLDSDLQEISSQTTSSGYRSVSDFLHHLLHPNKERNYNDSH